METRVGFTVKGPDIKSGVPPGAGELAAGYTFGGGGPRNLVFTLLNQVMYVAVLATVATFTYYCLDKTAWSSGFTRAASGLYGLWMLGLAYVALRSSSAGRSRWVAEQVRRDLGEHKRAPAAQHGDGSPQPGAQSSDASP